jgi:opacity protein-like surface antigen
VRRTYAFIALIAAACLLVASTTSSHAEEIESKWRLGFSLAGYNTTDQVHSASGNRRTLFFPDGEVADQLFDPRNDSGALSDFGIESSYGGYLSASYAFTRMWFVEGSVGYRQGTVGNVELQAQFQGIPIPITQRFNFTVFNLNGGTLKQVPLQVTGGIRFRPKAAFNPFIDLGVGYTLNSYQPSAEINQLSRNLDQTTATFARLTGTLLGGETLNPEGPSSNLSGITVDAPNAPEWHFGGGFEFSFHSHWVVFVDARYTVYSGKFAMHVNGSSELGISVPGDRRFITDPDAFGPFGAYSITQGGLIDGGSLAPLGTSPPGTNCALNPELCAFTGPKDGVLDPGMYYVHAGAVRYDGASLQIGVKYTF